MQTLPPLGIHLDGVAKAFGRQAALRAVDLDVSAGSYVAVMGANGAGKSTMLKVIAGLITPTRGTVSIGGIDMRRAGPRLRAMVGYVSHETMLYADLSGRENLSFHAKLQGLGRGTDAIDLAVERFGIGTYLDQPVRALSRGMRQRVALARALLHEPRVVLLDEPFTGLDEAAAIGLTETLEELATPERVLMVTLHDVARALSGPQRLLALSGGRIVMDRPLHEADDDIAASYLELLREEVAR
jgi:ABC-type multidrug transport system ATPase subunit